MHRTALLGLVATIIALAVACGGSGDSPAQPTGPVPTISLTALAAGPALSLADAEAYIVLVRDDGGWMTEVPSGGTTTWRCTGESGSAAALTPDELGRVRDELNAQLALDTPITAGFTLTNDGDGTTVSYSNDIPDQRIDGGPDVTLLAELTAGATSCEIR